MSRSHLIANVPRHSSHCNAMKFRPMSDTQDLRDGSFRPRYKYSTSANMTGQDALKQIIVSTGTYCNNSSTTFRLPMRGINTVSTADGLARKVHI